MTRTIIAAGLGALTTLGALAALATPAQAQPIPPGSYQQQCRNIRMEGQFLSATCGGVRGGGQSSINVASCAGDIGVDASGALSCVGPGAAGPYRDRPYRDGREGGYNPGPLPPGVGDPRYDDRYDRGGRDEGRGYERGYGRRDRGAVTVFDRRDFRGRPIRFDGPVSNLGNTGLNDAIRSIQLGRRSGAWLICTDANFRGRCATINHSIPDTRQIGMRDAISSLRPLDY